MAKEIITETSAELFIKAKEAVRVLNEAVLDDVHSKITESKEILDALVAKHNKAAMNEAFAILRANENPMLAAIERLEIYTTKVVANKNKDTDIITYDLDPKAQTFIDLLAFENFCRGKQIAHDPAWKHKIEKFNYLCALRIAKELGLSVEDVKKKYHIDDKAMEQDMGKTPTSNTQMLAQLQTIVDSIIYLDNPNNPGHNVYKATSHDVRFLVGTLTKAGQKKHQLVFSQNGTVRNIITRIINRIVTDGSYELKYTTKKDANKAAAEATKPEAPKSEDAADQAQTEE